MTFRSTFFILSVLLFVSACGSTAQFSAPKLDSDLTIDGRLSDWDTNETLIESRDDINFHTTFDDEFLYLFINVRNLQRDRSIRQSGFIVYLSDDEDMRKSVGVSFPAGTFNLLREYPAQHSAFLRENDWLASTENRELLSQLEEEIFNRVMIVERFDGRSNPEYGFVDLSQLEVDGFEIGIDQDRRFLGIEMRIPRDGSSIYGFSSNRVWLGLAVETPNFRRQTDSEYNSSMQTGQRDAYGNRQRRVQPRQNISRSLGEFEQWFRINLQ
jgi:hypothetical protein